MKTIYLDSSVLVAFLYEESDQPERFRQAQQLILAIRDGTIQAIVSFYALPELYGYVARHYPESEINSAFRLSLVELFSVPLIVAPFLDREVLNRLRQQFTIADADDARHIAVALSRKCDSIITFDYHFRQVADLIPVFEPDEFLATLTNPDAR